jgi:hypothetical protein
LLNLNSQAFSIGIVFFGFYCLLIGYLIFRSTFLPRAIGVLMALAGLGYLTFLYPPLEYALSLYLQVPGLLGEGSLTLWLLVVGVNAQRWKEQARAARRRCTHENYGKPPSAPETGHGTFSKPHPARREPVRDVA